MQGKRWQLANCKLTDVNQHPPSLFHAHATLRARERALRTILCTRKLVHAKIKFVEPCWRAPEQLRLADSRRISKLVMAIVD